MAAPLWSSHIITWVWTSATSTSKQHRHRAIPCITTHGFTLQHTKPLLLEVMAPWVHAVTVFIHQILPYLSVIRHRSEAVSSRFVSLLFSAELLNVCTYIHGKKTKLIWMSYLDNWRKANALKRKVNFHSSFQSDSITPSSVCSGKIAPCSLRSISRKEQLNRKWKKLTQLLRVGGFSWRR